MPSRGAARPRPSCSTPLAKSSEKMAAEQVRGSRHSAFPRCARRHEVLLHRRWFFLVLVLSAGRRFPRLSPLGGRAHLHVRPPLPLQGGAVSSYSPEHRSLRLSRTPSRPPSSRRSRSRSCPSSSTAQIRPSVPRDGIHAESDGGEWGGRARIIVFVHQYFWGVTSLRTKPVQRHC